MYRGQHSSMEYSSFIALTSVLCATQKFILKGLKSSIPFSEKNKPLYNVSHGLN